MDSIVSTMETQPEATCNPWSSDNSAFGLKNAILLAENAGLIFRKAELEDGIQAKLKQMPSLQMIDTQRRISEHNTQMSKVNFEIQRRMLYDESKDVADIDVIERRTKEAKKLADHLQTVISNKEALITRLQQPHVGTYIKLEAAFHRHASEFFSQLAPVLSDLTSHLNDLSWVNNSTFCTDQLDSLVSELSGALAGLQTQFQSMVQVSRCIQGMHATDHESLTATTSFDLH